MATHQTLLRAVASTALALLIFSVACVASETTLQGQAGEYCNGYDNDCEAPLICHDYVCTYSDDVYWDECNTICNRTDECNVIIDQCRSSCVNSTRQWGEEPMENFVACFVDDLSCEELQESDNPPQTCYRQLELPEARSARCSAFVDAARECGANSDELEDLRDECRYMGRTRSDEVWAMSDECVNRVNDGVCNDIYHCLNQTFALDDPGLPATGDPDDANIEEMNDESNDLNGFVDGEAG